MKTRWILSASFVVACVTTYIWPQCNTSFPIPLGESIGGGFVITKYPFNLNKTFEVNVDLPVAQTPGGCSPATWRIRMIEVGVSPTPGEGLFYRFLRPYGVPDVSQIEGIFTDELPTGSNVRWECQG